MLTVCLGRAASDSVHVIPVLANISSGVGDDLKKPNNLLLFLEDAGSFVRLQRYSGKLFRPESLPVQQRRSAVTGLRQNKQPRFFRISKDLGDVML